MPKVSVIIPTYNCDCYLDESITSVLNQSYRDFELIVVDDGSTDNTAVVIKPYLNNPKIRYVKKSKREGLPAARNTGIETAGGAFIAFLDADDLFLKDKLLKQLDIFEKKRTYGICYTNQIYFGEGTGEEIVSTRCHFSGDVFYYLKRSNFIPVSSVMARSEILKENKFNNRLKSHEDWALYLRLASKGIRFLYIREPLSKIRVRRHSMTVNTDVMNNSRREVGLEARVYWRDFKRRMQPFSREGQRAILRYMKMKTKAYLIGFPRRDCFNRPVPQELLG